MTELELKQRHLYYFDPKVIDLAVLRKDALKISTGDYRNRPVPVTIHHHRRDDACLNNKHEEYGVRDG